MRLHRGLPWLALVLSSPAHALAQATVGDDNAATPVAENPRLRRSVSLSSDPAGSVAGDPLSVPEFHTVERGDTLWDITANYFGTPYRWPGVWGLNPQITNPHWIYPGDQVRLLRADQLAASTAGRRAVPVDGPSAGMPLRARVPAQTVFLREEGWLDRREAESSGTISGSPEDQLLLAEGDTAYVDFPSRTPRIGEDFTIYQDAQGARSGDRPSGHVVRILGTARVQSWDPDRHTATVRIAESLDGIERGERVAALPRRLRVVPPVRNTVDLRGQIVATVQPRELVGQQMVVFVDRGADDHVAVGNRFEVVRRGDAWRQSLTVREAQVTGGGGLDRDGDGNIDGPPGHVGADSSMPEEVVGELLIVDVRPRSATAVVTGSIVEVAVGDAVAMRRGY